MDLAELTCGEVTIIILSRIDLQKNNRHLSLVGRKKDALIL